jgi:hypothetical protein
MLDTKEEKSVTRDGTFRNRIARRLLTDIILLSRHSNYVPVYNIKLILRNNSFLVHTC